MADHLCAIHGEVPMCTSCMHRHFQGIKCTICGHVGKSQLFTKMKDKSEERMAYRFFSFCGAVIQQEDVNIVVQLKHDLARIYSVEGSPADVFWSTNVSNSFHFVCQRGDAPVAVASVECFDVRSVGSQFYLVITQFAVLPDHKRRGIGKKLLSHLQTSLPAILRTHPTAASLTTAPPLVCVAPAGSFIEAQLSSMGWSPIQAPPQAIYMCSAMVCSMTQTGSPLQWMAIESGTL